MTSTPCASYTVEFGRCQPRRHLRRLLVDRTPLVNHVCSVWWLERLDVEYLIKYQFRTTMPQDEGDSMFHARGGGWRRTMTMSYDLWDMTSNLLCHTYTMIYDHLAMTNDQWPMTNDQWKMTSDILPMTYNLWHMTYGWWWSMAYSLWFMINDLQYMTYDLSTMTFQIWPFNYDLWPVNHNE